MFLNVLTQVVILFILIALGYIMARTKMLNDNAVKCITEFVLMLVTPCVIIKSFIREFNLEILKTFLVSILAAVVCHIVFILITSLTLHDADKRAERVLKYAAVFSNCGYMSIPLQQALLGDDGVFFSASYIAVFNVFCWTYGVLLMSGDKKYLTPKKLLLNPGIIGMAIGLAVFLLSLPVPKVIYEPISYLASLNTPLPMIIIGYHLANSSLSAGLKNVKCIFSVLLKLVIFPLTALTGLYLCGVRGVLFVSLVISCSAPVAANTTMFSSKFGADTSLSVNLVSLSTLCSLITMPLIITLAQVLA